MTVSIGHQTAGELTHVSFVRATQTIAAEFGVILDHTRVSWHIREEYQRQTTHEQTGTATHLQ